MIADHPPHLLSQQGNSSSPAEHGKQHRSAGGSAPLPLGTPADQAPTVFELHPLDLIASEAEKNKRVCKLSDEFCCLCLEMYCV